MMGGDYSFPRKTFWISIVFLHIVFFFTYGFFRNDFFKIIFVDFIFNIEMAENLVL